MSEFGYIASHEGYISKGERNVFGSETLCMRLRYRERVKKIQEKEKTRVREAPRLCLQENGKAKEDTAKDGSKTQTGIGHEDGAGTLVAVVVTAAAAAASGLGATETSDGNGVGGGGRWGSGGGHGGRQRRVALVGFLSTARVVLSAGALAGSVVAAVADAVCSPLLADEVGQGLGVLGDVGRGTVVADAAVGQVVRVAVIFLGGHGVDTGLLEADERAGGNVLGAPVISGGGWDGIGVDGVGVVLLDSRLSSSEASEGGNAEGED